MPHDSADPLINPDESPSLDFLPRQNPAHMRAHAQETDGLLELRFDMATVQSAMRLEAPNALELEYTRVMMRCLLFQPAPRRLLMLGLGGGSLAKYCHHHFQHADITAVEINPHVIALRERFQVPPDGGRFRVVQGDGAVYVQGLALKDAPLPIVGPANGGVTKPGVAKTGVTIAGPHFDAILVDAFHFDGAPASINSRSFFSACRALLSPQGVLVLNMEGEPDLYQPVLGNLSRAFDGAVWSVPCDASSNRIGFAARQEHLMATMRQADTRLAALPPVHRETLTRRVDNRLSFGPLFG